MYILYLRFRELFLAPVHHPSMIWIVVPLLMALLLMTIYFAKYRDEELGWNTALGNSLVLIFVSVNLFQTNFNDGRATGAIVLASLIFFLGLLLIFVNFTHFLPRKVAYFLSSPLSINLIAYTAIAVVYSKIPYDYYTLLSAILFLFGLFLFFLTIGLVSKKWWIIIEKMKSKEHIEDVKKGKKFLESKKQEIKVQEKKINKVLKKHQVELKEKQVEIKKIKKVARRK